MSGYRTSGTDIILWNLATSSINGLCSCTLSKMGMAGVARLLMNLALIQDGYLPVIVPPVLRLEYVSLLERAHRMTGTLWHSSQSGSLNRRKRFCGCFRYRSQRKNRIWDSPLRYSMMTTEERNMKMAVCRIQKCVRFFCAHGHPEEDFQPELTGAKQGKMALPCLILLTVICCC